MSIYGKIIGLCLGLVFFTGFLLLYYAQIESRSSLEAEIAEKLSYRSEQNIRSIDRFIYERRQDLRYIASDPAFRNPGSPVALLGRRLADYKKEEDLAASISFFNMDRLRLADTENLSVGRQHSLSKYWLKLARGEDEVIDVSRSESLGETVMHFARVVRSESGKKVGVVVSRLIISRLYEVFTSHSSAESGTIFTDLIDRKGVILYTDRKGADILSPTGLPAEVWQKQAEQPLPFRESGDTLYFPTRQKGYFSYRGNQWTLVTSVPKETAYLPAEILGQKMIFLLIPVLIMAALFSLWAAYFLTHPVIMLNRAVEQIGAGNFDTPIYIRSRDEIGKLAQSFKEMAETLRNKMSEQDELNRELSGRLSKIKEQKDKIQGQNHLIEIQNKKIRSALEQIEMKNKSITSGINYARRIRASMLPERELLQAHFPQSFILDMPRDIVSGDFYWFDELPVREKTYFVIAVADCTGHGVPGGFMAVLGSNLLSTAVSEEKTVSPSDVLLKINRRIKKALHQEIAGQKIQDGMDIGLCVIDKEDGKMIFSGAGRPLYLLRNNEITEFKGDKISIGGVGKRSRKSGTAPERMTEHCIRVLPGDEFFMCSDGFRDQISEKLDKKFSSKRLRNTLLEMRHFPQENRENDMRKVLTDWQGNSKQLDDILMLGFRFPEQKSDRPPAIGKTKEEVNRLLDSML